MLSLTTDSYSVLSTYQYLATARATPFSHSRFLGETDSLHYQEMGTKKVREPRAPGNGFPKYLLAYHSKPKLLQSGAVHNILTIMKSCTDKH